MVFDMPSFVYGCFGGFIVMLSVPRIIMWGLIRKFRKNGAINRFLPSPMFLPTSERNPIVRMSPDLMYTAGTFDMSSDYILTLTFPSDTYSSLSFYANDTDNFACVSNESPQSKISILLCSNSKSCHSDTVDYTVVAPTADVVAILRIYVPEKSNEQKFSRFHESILIQKLPKAELAFNLPIYGILPILMGLLAASASSILFVVGLFSFTFLSWGISKATFGKLSNKYWTFNPFVGSKQASILTRTFVAVQGLLGLSSTEAVYLLRYTDDSGEALSSDNTYALKWQLPDPSLSKWWSITAYTNSGYLIPNQHHIHAVNSKENQSKTVEVTLGTQHNSSNGQFLPSGLPNEGHKFNLTLRLYKPRSDVSFNFSNIALPTISKV